MYFNNIHIMVYFGIAAIGCIVGRLMAWCNLRFPEDKKIFSKEYFSESKAGNIKGSYIMMFCISIIYIFLLYKFGINENFIKNLDLIKYLILTPMLLATFIIDYNYKIIPNRLNLTMFEIGIIFTFLYGLSNVAISINMLLGMLAGGGIFLLITLLGGLAYGKEAMGLR